MTKGTEESLPSPWLPPPSPEKLGVAKGLAQKFEISSCVLKLATKNVGTRNEKNVITEICVACAGKGSGTEICDTEICVEHVLAKILGQEMKDVICLLFHFLRRQANNFLIR